MSDGFLTRWSRRKREATEAASSAPEAAPGDQASPVDPATPILPHPTENPPAAQPPRLPPVESIDAGTDIRAYLAKEVAPDLARAALRRAWLADPAIRDFVGLADYDWDFNAPGRMPGFGPLRPTDDVQQLLSHLLGNDTGRREPEDLRDASPNHDGQAAGDSPTADCCEQPEHAVSDKQTTEPRHDDAAKDTHAAPAEDAMARRDGALQNREASALKYIAPLGRRHGRALPE